MSWGAAYETNLTRLQTKQNQSGVRGILFARIGWEIYHTYATP